MALNESAELNYESQFFKFRIEAMREKRKQHR